MSNLSLRSRVLVLVVALLLGLGSATFAVVAAPQQRALVVIVDGEALAWGIRWEVQ